MFLVCGDQNQCFGDAANSFTDCHDQAPVVPLVLHPMCDTFSTTRCLQNIDSFRVCVDPEETEEVIWSNTFIDVKREVISFLCPPHFPQLRPSHLSAFLQRHSPRATGIGMSPGPSPGDPGSPRYQHKARVPLGQRRWGRAGRHSILWKGATQCPPRVCRCGNKCVWECLYVCACVCDYACVYVHL